MAKTYKPQTKTSTGMEDMLLDAGSLNGKKDTYFAKASDITVINQKIAEIELTKFPNVTIIGQPTIQQGQISNFTVDNYVRFPFIVNFQNRPFVIDFAMTTGSDISSQQNLLDSTFGLAFAVRNSKFVLAVSSTGTNWDFGELVGSHTLSSNTSYRVRISWNGSDYTYSYSTDGGQTYTVDATKSFALSPYPKQIYIGRGADGTHVFKGIIDLNYATLTISDKVVWQGMDDVGLATRMAVDMSNIDDAGVEKIKDIVKIVIEVGSAQEVFFTKVFPKIPIDIAKNIYDTYISGNTVIIRWKVMNAIPVEATVLGSDNVGGFKSFSFIMHDTYAVEYKYNDSTTGYAETSVIDLKAIKDVSKSDINGNIKIDGDEVTVYTLPSMKTINGIDILGTGDIVIPKGDTGPEGPQGPKGDKGNDGYTPVKGVDYFDGAQGPTGPKGADSTVPGPQGPKGDPGTTSWNGITDKPDLSVYAKLAQANNLIHSGNEFTIVPSGYNDDIWFNYRTIGGTNGSIKSYIFGDGATGRSILDANGLKLFGKYQSGVEASIWLKSYTGESSINYTNTSGEWVVGTGTGGIGRDFGFWTGTGNALRITADGYLHSSRGQMALVSEIPDISGKTNLSNVKHDCYYSNSDGSRYGNPYGEQLQFGDNDDKWIQIRGDWGDDFERGLSWRSKSDRGNVHDWRTIFDSRYNVGNGADKSTTFASYQMNGGNPAGLSGVYDWGTYLSFAQQNSRFEIYAPHTGTLDSGIWVRTGWGQDGNEDRKPWKRLAFIDDIPSGGGIPTITTDSIRPWSMDPGVYLWTYNGTHRVYYDGASSTNNFSLYNPNGTYIVRVWNYGNTNKYWTMESSGTAYFGTTMSNSGSYFIYKIGASTAETKYLGYRYQLSTDDGAGLDISTFVSCSILNFELSGIGTFTITLPDGDGETTYSNLCKNNTYVYQLRCTMYDDDDVYYCYFSLYRGTYSTSQASYSRDTTPRDWRVHYIKCDNY